MAFNIQEARNEGYSDSEIAEYLAKQKKFNIESARKEGYYDDEIINHLVESDTQQPEGNSIGNRIKSVFSDTAKNMTGAVAKAGLTLVKGANNLNVIDQTEYAPYTPNTGVQTTDIGNKAFEQTVGNNTQLKDPNAPTVLKAPEQPEVNFTNVVKGIAKSLPQGIESTKQGIRAQYADAIDSEAMASDAQLQAQRNRNDIQDSTPAFESSTASGLYSGATSLIQQTPSLVASIATGNPAIALTNAGLTTEAEAYTRYKERGATPQEALTGAVSEGIVEVLTEAIPMKFLVDKFGKTNATKLVAGFIAKDALPEQVATLAQDAIDTAIANPNKTWGDYLAERPDAAYQTLLATVVQAGAIGGASYITNKIAGNEIDQKKLEKIKTLPTQNLKTLRDTASKINPTDVPVIDEELNRRAGLGTLTRAAEEAQRQGITQPQNEAIEASDLLEEDNVSAPIEQPATDMATETSGLAGDNQFGSTTDTAIQPVTNDALDSTQELEPSIGSDIPAGIAASEPDANITDQDWQTFPPETETLGVPRDEMPQIKAEHRGAMVNFLNARDITHESETVPASSLKPTQQEFSLSKVQKAKDFEGGNRSILISSDNHVLDGHHQWLSKLEQDEPIDVIRLNAPIADLIATVKEFPSATTETTEPDEFTNRFNAKREVLQSWVPDMKWETEGGKIIRDADGNVTGRTVWQAKDPQFDALRRQAGVSFPAMQEAVNKAANGEKLTKKQKAINSLLMDFQDELDQQNGVIEPVVNEDDGDLFDTAGMEMSQADLEAFLNGTDNTESQSNAVAKQDEARDAQTGSGSDIGIQAGIGSEIAQTPQIQSAPKQEGADQRVRDQVEAIVKRRAAANELGKLKAFDLYLQTAKEFMNGGKPNTAKFTVAASIFKGDPALANAFNELKALAQPQTKAERKEKVNVVETYKQIIADAKSVAELQSIARDIQEEKSLSDTKSAELDDLVMDRIDALENDGPKTAENDTEIAEKPSKKAISDMGPKADLLGDDTKAKQAIADAQREKDAKRNTGVSDTEGFTLTGSNSEADKAIANGAQDLFAQPEKPKYENIQDLGEKIGGARKDTAVSTGTKSKRSSDDDLPTWAKRYKFYQEVTPAGAVEPIHPEREGKWGIFDSRDKNSFGHPRQVGGRTLLFDTKEEALKALPSLVVGLKHRVYATAQRADGTNRFEIYRNINDRKRVKIVDKEFDTREEALTYMADHATEILETSTTFGEIDLPTPDDTNRIGAPRRKGDVQGKDFIETFGFRGVEFGNWNNQIERQQLMNAAYDGLLDLAEVLNIPPKAIALNGDLALAFGARGQGLSSAKAHYESDKVVINLTKMNGAGSLAHEWFHAMDHYFARQDGKSPNEWVIGSDGTRSLKQSRSTEDNFVSHGFNYKSNVREEVRDAYKALMQTMFTKATTYVEDTVQADKFVERTKDDLAKRLDGIRKELSTQKNPEYYKRNNKPASAEQLGEFDTIAKQLLEGQGLDTEYRMQTDAQKRSGSWKARMTNDALEQISAIYKAVRGRSGFGTSNSSGTMDYLRGDMKRYGDRLRMLASAQSGEEKVKNVPTDFAMNAKELDQGRGTDYWTTNHEMAARAFQGYVQDKIAEKQGQSPFLNYGPENVGILTPWGFKRPFPRGEERKAINKALDKFIETIKTKESDDGNVAMFSRTESTQGLPKDTVQTIVDNVKSKWENAPPIFVVDSMQDEAIPKRVRDYDMKLKSNGATGNPVAFISGGKVFILSSMVKDTNAVREALFHETLGHFGLRGTYGDELTIVLDDIVLLRRKDVLAKAKSYGFSISLSEAKINVMRELKKEALLKNASDEKSEILNKLDLSEYDKASDELVTSQFDDNQLNEKYKDRLKSDLRKAAEEVLAEMAQTRPEIGFVKRAIAAIRKFLRSVGINLKLTDNDIIANYLLPARRYVENGGKEKSPTILARSGLQLSSMAQARSSNGKVLRVSDLVNNSATEAMFSRAHNTSNIPDAIILNPLGTAKNNADYELSKSGDVEAATRLAKALVTSDVVKKLKDSIKNADLVVGVTSIEQSGTNALPEAAAVLIAEKLGIKYEENILQATTPKRTGMNGLDRIFNRPVFTGDVKNNAGYIFVDDTITQGGTFAALSAHVVNGGGSVVANIALTGKEYSSKIALSDSALKKVRDQYGDLENEFKQATGYDFTGLTESESRYVTSGIIADKFRDRIIAESEKATRNSNQETTQSEVNSSDTAFSRDQQRLQPTWETLEESTIDNLIRTFQDKQIDLKRVTQAIKKTGVDLANRFDAYLQEELYHGRTAKRVDDFVKGELDPLIKEMQSLDVSMESLEEYLWMRHAEERNVQNARVNPDMPDGGSGKTTAEARAYLAGLSNEQKQKYEALAKRVDAISANNKQVLIDYNLESPSTIAKWDKTYQHYVPLMREEMDLGFGMGTGQGFSVKGTASKRAIGSNLKVVNIIANLAEQRERNITRGEENRVATALIGMAKLNPNEDFWEVDKPPRIKAISKTTGLAEEYTDPKYKSRPNVVVARIKNKNGEIEERSVVFSEFDERAMSMSASIKNLDVEQMEKALGYVSHVTRYFASVNTQYNPIFGVLNILRDVQGSLLNLSTTPLKDYSKAKILKDTGAAMAGIYQELRSVRKDEGTVNSEWSTLWEEFQNVGGKTGYRDMFANATDRTEALKKALDPEWWAKTKVGKVVSAGGLLTQPEMLVKDKAIKPIFDWLSDYNETLENSVRLSVYKAGLDKGLTKQEAASIAKNISVNFNRKGNMGRTIGALYAFFNAAVQGNARIIETLKGPAGKKIIYGGLILGSMQALLLAAYGYNEDEPPEFIRNRNIIIPLDIVGIDKKYVAIPMPLGFNAIPNVGRIITETVLSGGDHFGKRLEGLFTMLMDTTNPIGGSGSLMSIVTPTALDPFNDLDKNKDWTGRSISKEDFSSTNPTPGYTRSRDKAWGVSVEIARYINNLSGGTDYKQGIFSPTADEIEYLAGQVGGGVSRELIKAGTTVDSLITGEDLPSYKIPLAGRFYGDAAGQAAQGATFYENIRKLNEHEAEIKGRRKDGLSVIEYKKENPETALVFQANHYEKVVRNLTKKKREKVERNAPATEIKRLDEKITFNMKKFNEMVKKKEASAQQ